MSRPAEAELARLARLLGALGVEDFAITGAVALGFWIEPRTTRDIDVIGDLPPAALLPLLAHDDGMRVGPSEIPDIVRFRLVDWEVDLFVAKTEEDKECLRRASRVVVGAAEVPVVSPEDLVLHKMRKLRSDRRRVLQDIADVRALLLSRQEAFDWDYVRSRLPADEADLLVAIRDRSDDELSGADERRSSGTAWPLLLLPQQPVHHLLDAGELLPHLAALAALGHLVAVDDPPVVVAGDAHAALGEQRVD